MRAGKLCSENIAPTAPAAVMAAEIAIFLLGNILSNRVPKKLPSANGRANCPNPHKYWEDALLVNSGNISKNPLLSDASIPLTRASPPTSLPKFLSSLNSLTYTLSLSFFILAAVWVVFCCILSKSGGGMWRKLKAAAATNGNDKKNGALQSIPNQRVAANGNKYEVNRPAACPNSVLAVRRSRTASGAFLLSELIIGPTAQCIMVLPKLANVIIDKIL